MWKLNRIGIEQENKELRKEIAELRKDCNHCNFHTYRSTLKEIRKLFPKQKPWKGMLTKLEEEILNKTNEVLE